MKFPPCLLRVDGVYGAIYDGVFIYVFILNSLHIRLHTVCVCWSVRGVEKRGDGRLKTQEAYERKFKPGREWCYSVLLDFSSPKIYSFKDVKKCKAAVKLAF